MHIKNCVIKRLPESIWLHHTGSGYKVRMNDETLGVLRSMASRRATTEMTENEALIYRKLAAKGMAGEDTGRDEDRRLLVREKSQLAQIDLEFSGRCNLRCAHCFASLSGKDMSAQTLEKVFAGIDALEPTTLILNGGEPLLNPLLPEALQRARARAMRVNIMTNGTLVGEDAATLLKNYGVAKAVVSLDFFEETHDAIRGAGAFAKAVRGIKLLVSRGVPVFITAMVQDRTAGQVAAFTDHCLKELGASGVRFAAVSPIGNAKSSKLDMRLSPERTRKLFSTGQLAAPGESDAAPALPGGRTFSCKAGVGQCFVSADGKVYACHFMQNLGESMGDLAEKSFETIYREYQTSAAAPVTLDWGKLEKCKACARFANCLGGCRARARILSGDWQGPDPHSCDIYGIKRGEI